MTETINVQQIRIFISKSLQRPNSSSRERRLIQSTGSKKSILLQFQNSTTAPLVHFYWFHAVTNAAAGTNLAANKKGKSDDLAFDGAVDCCDLMSRVAEQNNMKSNHDDASVC